MVSKWLIRPKTILTNVCINMANSLNPIFVTRIADSAADRRAAQRLRYQVFVSELGGDGPLVDHAGQLERDAFDDHADHI